MKTREKKEKRRERRNRSRQTGFFHLLGLFAIFAATLWYFQIDVRGFIDSHPEIRNFIAGGKEFFVSLYAYLSKLLTFVWHSVVLEYAWERGSALASQAVVWTKTNWPL